MALLHFQNIELKAISSCVPKSKELTVNYDHLTSEEQQLFIKTTGIKERRVADAGVTCSDLCLLSAQDLLKKFPGQEDIGLLLFVSQSPDYYLPATAVILQNKLRLPKGCMAFDINLGCSGYIYGLSVVAAMMQSGQIKKALLLAGDKSTSSTVYSDKSAYPLFGDAGTATLLEYKEGAKGFSFHLQSDGSGERAIIIEDGHCRNPYTAESEKIAEIEPGISRAKKHLALNGTDIFNFALKEVAKNIEELLVESHTQKESIDHFVFHQANKLINESVRKKLKIDISKTPYSIDIFGNTSSASIPLTICNALEKELRTKKLKLLLSGFGVGYSWGSAILETENVYTSLLEYDRP